MKRKFIINPASSAGLSPNNFKQIQNFFIRSCGEFDYEFTKNFVDIENMARKAFYDGYEQVIAVGGDGTINGVVNGYFENAKAINPSACVAVSNTGTGSDYYKTLINNSKVSDWKQIVLNPIIKTVDVGYVEFSDSSKNRFFNNMASVGISAKIVEKKEKLPLWLPKQLKYILPTLMALPEYKTKNAKITVANGEYNVDLMSLFVCKGLYAGGGMRLGGNSIVDDGMFAITLVDKIKTGKVIANLHKLYTNKLDQFSEIILTKSNFINLLADSPINIELDGENWGEVSEFNISLFSQAVRLCFANVKLPQL